MKHGSEPSYIPISQTYPQTKMELAGSKRKPPRADLREQVLKRESKRQQSLALSDQGAAASNLSQEAMNLLEVQLEAAEMPTDFSAFNASLKPDTSLPGRQAPAAGRQLLPTFQDLTSARTAEVADEQRNAAARAYLEVTRSFSIKAEERPRAGAAEAGANSAAAAAGTGQQHAALGGSRAGHQLQDLACPPLDWSLKSSVRVVSSSAFPGLSPAALCATRPASRARQCIATTSGATTSSGLSEALPAALLNWQHPASSMSADAIAELHASAATRQVLQQRLSSWRAALRSLYYQLRHGGCHAFYVVANQGHKAPYAALFTASGVRGCSRPHALVSQSSTSLRNRLLRLQLHFSMPGHEQPEQQRTAAGGGGLPAKYDCTARSQLQLEGEAAVHGLFDLLYNEAGYAAFGEPCADLPLLLAPAPFEGACLQQPQLRLVQGAFVVAPGSEGETGSGGNLHKLEVSGLVPGWAVQRLLHVLAAAGCEQFTAHLVTGAASESLNRLSAASSSRSNRDWAPMGMALGGARGRAELHQWQAEVAVLAGGVMSEVQYGSGFFSCRLTGAQMN